MSTTGKGYEDREAPLPERSIKRPLADEEFFEKEEHIAFSPINQNLFNVENLAMLVLVVKLSKTPEGVQALKQIALKYLECTARIIESVEDACHSNWLTALNNQQITLAMAHRIGLINNGAYIRIAQHYRAVFDKMLVKGYITDTISSVTTLVQGSKTTAKETLYGYETGATGIGALAAILKGLGT